MLVPGHREALNRLISLAAAAVAVDLPEIAADVTSVDDGVIRMSLLVPSGDLSIMRRGIEEAVQSWVLHNCYLCGRSRAAESYEREYKARIKALKEKAGASAAVPRLRPSRY